MAKYMVTARIRGTVDKAEEQLWTHEFNLTDISSPEILDVEEVEHMEKSNSDNCMCDYAESGLCGKCQVDQKGDISLGGCYHTGLAYSLAYDAHGKIELTGKTFTNLDAGLDGGAMGALREHRQNFDPSKDVPYFIVALKPVDVIFDPMDDETYEQWNNNGYCNNCGEICTDCNCDNTDPVAILKDDDDTDCHIEFVIVAKSAQIELETDCDCDEFDQEFISDTFRPMNAFDRARWLKGAGEIK